MYKMGLYNNGSSSTEASRQSVTRAFPQGCGRNPQPDRIEEHPKVVYNFPHREISCIRAFPPGCRRNPQPIRIEEHPKAVFNFPHREISSIRAFPPGCGRNPQPVRIKGNSVGCERNCSEPRPSEKTVRNEANHARQNFQDGYACRHPLMGASNSPCTIGINVKKHELMEVRKCISASSEKRQKTEYSKGLTTKKKVPPKGKVAYLDPCELVGRLKDDNLGHDKEYGNVINGCKASVVHDRAIETLNLFRNIYKEAEKELKEHEDSTNRIDLLAFNRLKTVKPWLNSSKAIVGSIPGVEVGDKFQYRVELYVVGLHHHFQSGIDYLMKGGKIIATSIVASGGYDNDMCGPEVFVYCGQGGKPMKGVEQPKDQKLVRGNLALKNSIEAKNVVRVIFGSKEIKDFDSINPRDKRVSYYVYDGLYLVEKFWRETGHYGTSIFKFELRRVPDQSKLHVRKNSKELEVPKHNCLVDTTQGKEKMGIYAANTVDGDKHSPFKYSPNHYNYTVGQVNHFKGNIKKKI